MISPDLRERFRFFHCHDGWATPPGKAACALRSARLETLLDQGIALGVASVEWRDDELYEPWGDCGIEEEETRKLASGEWVALGCTVTVGDASESLWGIVVESENDPYCRCVVADLAYGLEDDLRQAIGDALDREQGICFA